MLPSYLTIVSEAWSSSLRRKYAIILILLLFTMKWGCLESKVFIQSSPPFIFNGSLLDSTIMRWYRFSLKQAHISLCRPTNWELCYASECCSIRISSVPLSHQVMLYQVVYEFFYVPENVYLLYIFSVTWERGIIYQTFLTIVYTMVLMKLTTPGRVYRHKCTSTHINEYIQDYCVNSKVVEYGS